MRHPDSQPCLTLLTPSAQRRTCVLGQAPPSLGSLHQVAAEDAYANSGPPFAVTCRR